MNPGEREGPPQRESPPAANRGAITTTGQVVDSPKSSGPVRQCHGDTVGLVGLQLRRRRAASQRMVPLDCGCIDPWPCRCTEPPLSERMIDAGREAARHILEAGHLPLLELEVLQALWRRGGDDRALAEQLHAATGGRIG